MSVERFYIIRDGGREGPYDETYVRFLLENDEVDFDDLCETEDGKRVRLGEMYEPLDDEPEPEDEEELETAVPRKGGRRLLYVGRPSFLKYPVSWVLVLVGAVGGCVVGPYSLWGMLGLFALASFAIIFIVLDRSSHLYVITSRRIEGVHGLMAKDSTEIRIEDIRTINVRRTGIPGLLGVGTVDFSSTGDAIDVSFGDVWAARRIKKLVRRLQDELE